MKRRKLLNQVAFSAAGAGVLGACSRQDQFYKGGDGASASLPLIEWRMANSWAEDSPRFTATQNISDLISLATNDRFRITVFPEGSIAPRQEILNAIETGVVECGFTLGHYYLDRSLAMALDSALPFGLDENQYEIWLYGAGGLEMMRRVYAEFNIINFPAGETGKQMGGWFKRKVQSLSDLQSLKIRFPGIGSQVLERLNVETVNLPVSEIRPALERNDIEAAEIASPFEDEQLGVYEVAPYYYYPGWQQPRSSISLFINKTAWEELPPAYQAAIEMATAISYRQMKAESIGANGGAIKRLKEAGVEVVPLPSDIMQATQDTTNELLQEYASQDAAFRELYEHSNAFFEEFSSWNSLTV